MNAVLRISDRDNVATALEPLECDRSIDIGGGQVAVTREAIPSGHKVAIREIARGSAVIKYGSSIGTATMAIECGRHVHTHNLSSDRGRGDVSSRVLEPGARLAEPLDGVGPDGVAAIEGADQSRG